MQTTRRGFFGTVAAAVLGGVAAKALPAAPPQAAMQLSTQAGYTFGFTGFKPAIDNPIVGQILMSGNLQVRAPRMVKQLYGLEESFDSTQVKAGDTLYWLR